MRDHPEKNKMSPWNDNVTVRRVKITDTSQTQTLAVYCSVWWASLCVKARPERLHAALVRARFML